MLYLQSVVISILDLYLHRVFLGCYIIDDILFLLFSVRGSQGDDKSQEFYTVSS